MELQRYRWTAAMLDVPFALGALGATALSGPSLVRLLCGLGREESAARNLLVRMRTMGALEVEQRGRVNCYRLGASSTDRYREVEGTQERADWSGTFDAVLYHVPEKQRTLRDRLQHTARAAGYGLLRAGVLIAATPRWHRLHMPWEELGGESWMERVELRPADRADGLRMARRAWDLDALNESYGRALRRCAETPALVEPSWATLRHWRELYAAFFDALLTDPHLPAELLPEDWLQPRFALAQNEVNVRIGRVLLPYLRQQADERDPGGVNEYYPPPWS